MEKHTPPTPLIKTITIVGVVILLVYSIGTSPDHTLWSGLGALVLSLLKALQLIVALVIALAVCILTLFGIYIGALAMSSREQATTAYAELKTACLEGLAKAVEGLSCCCPCNDDRADIEAVKSKQQAGRVAETALQAQVEQQGQKLETLTNRLEKLSQQNETLQRVVAQLGQQGSGQAVDQVVVETPRLFSYIDDRVDQKKLAAFTAEAIAAKMTYATTQNFLEEKLPACAETLKAHPSLLKDYIRLCKQEMEG